MIARPGQQRLGALQHTWNLVVDGDSNTDPEFSESPWWTQLTAFLEYYPNITMGGNFAIAGHSWANLVSRQATVNAAATGERNALLLMCGGNDITGATVTGAQVATRAQNYVNAAVGWDAIILMHALPHNGNEPHRIVTADYNALMPSVTGVSFVIKHSHVPQLANSLNSTYFADSLHMNTAGAAVMARLAKYQLNLRLPWQP